MTEIRIHLSEIAEWNEGNLSAGNFAGMVSNARPETGIHITSIATPESGWPMMTHCDLCGETIIFLHPYGARPLGGDIFRVTRTCMKDDVGSGHTSVMWKYSSADIHTVKVSE